MQKTESETYNTSVTDPDTVLCCVEKKATVTSLQPILKLSHKNTDEVQLHLCYTV